MLNTAGLQPVVNGGIAEGEEAHFYSTSAPHPIIQRLVDSISSLIDASTGGFTGHIFSFW